ncbi:MAG: PAS domain-containing protein, partial [Gemmatimonadaceae bacterium]|nr:PAS domain-containing protein [Chitinophagaceae bacterium]
NNSIDIFFHSLADDKKEKAIGVVLSGTGTDGTKGLESIKTQGGIVLVQDPLSAEFDGMPNSAVSSGTADLILDPEMMPEELVEYLKEAPLIKSFNVMSKQEESTLLDILELVQRVTGHDFRNYKRPTLHRRLAKRMAEKNIKNLSDYSNYLGDNTEEVKLLCREFLINVTRFFRDEDAFDVIRLQVIPALFMTRQPGDTVKIWVVAVSTGEEAYSLAMLIDEYIQTNKKFDINVKIFATDVEQGCVDFASKGIYSEEAVKSVKPERVMRHFIKEGNTYRVAATIRKMVVFAKHDIAKDPPFSRIDLLTCRNMLIYMGAALQKSILQKFHFALNEDSYLFLGPSETVGKLKDVLRDVDRKWKIYKCISKAKTGEYETFLNPSERGHLMAVTGIAKSKNALSNLPEIFRDTLLEEYKFAGIFIDKDFEVKQAMGDFKDFINFPEQNFNFNLLKLVPPDLSIALNTAIRKASSTNTRVVNRKVKVRSGHTEKLISIVVKPYLEQKTYLQPFLFVVLHELPSEQITAKQPHADPREYSQELISDLEEELKITKANLQAFLEEVESANEELQSSNEEIVSANEELQSTNEELQSLNEELHTVNAEHQIKIKELIDLNDDMTNYFNNSSIGQILIDNKMIVRKFSPAATRQVNLIDSDIGRSITDISTNFKNLDFFNDIKDVMRTGEAKEKEINMNDDNILLMRIAPYLRLDKQRDGVVVSFVNIAETRKLASTLEAVFNSSTSGILAQKAIRDTKGAIVDFEYLSVNPAAEQMLGLTVGTLKGKRLREEFPTMDEDQISKYKSVVELGISIQFEFYVHDVRKWFEVICVKMMDGLVTTFTDITDKRKASDLLAQGYEELKVTTTKLEQSNFDLLQFASVASHDLKEPLRKIQAFGNLLKDRVRDKLDASEINYLEKVINSSNRMQGLVDDILTLSKLSNTQVPHIPTDLNEIATRIVDDLEITIKDKKSLVSIGKLPVIQAVPGQMHQLLQNLISNSLKFNESNPPVVKVEQKRVTEEIASEFGISKDEFVCIEVRDNGIGFEEKYSDKIFGIFQRLDGNTYQGSGIGLAICKKIVENYKGHIKATSELGKGSTFTILLPK